MTAPGDYCSFTKAVEHLGDRWSLLIVRELAVHGGLGFNGLAEALPNVSRSVLARRLRKLEDLAIVTRAGQAGSARPAPYRLAPAGEQLLPTLLSLREWAERWVPEGPALAERDPSVILLWLARRVDPAAAPVPQVALEFDFRDASLERTWLVVEHGAEPSICQDDPGLAEGRYVYVEAAPSVLVPISRGLRGWRSAIEEGSVGVYGEPALVRALPAWFRPAAVDVPADTLAAVGRG